MFHLIPVVPWLVVVFRFIFPLPWILPVKVVVAVILLIASQQILINRLSSGSVFAPEYPRPLIILFNALFGAMVLLAIFQLALDIASLAIGLVNQGMLMIPVSVRYGIGLLAFGLSIHGVYQAIRVPPVKNVEIAVKGLPASFEGYRILQLTDLHLSRLFPKSWAAEVVRRSNALGVDLIVITGDFIDGRLEDRRDDVEPLASLRAQDGVFAIPGNHEYYFGYESWMRHDAGMGIRMLLNDHSVIERGDHKLVIAGLTDLAARGSAFLQPDLNTALRGAPQAPIILLEHQPGMARRSAKAGVALQLSGHTHGGMVLGLDQIVARANDGFVSGLYQIDGMQLYVNNGTGLWPGFALRLGRPSELTVLTLKRM